MTKIYWFLEHEQFQPEVLVEHAKAAEDAGFDGVLVSEHFHPWVDDVGAGGFAFTTLGAVAATTGLELMTAVTTPLWRYHPAVVAQAAATLSRLSGEKFSLGVGTGENINEGPLGYVFPAYAERAARMREALEIMTRLLAGEKLDYAGTYYSTHAAKLYSPPLTEVPVYLAAGGPKSAVLAGELANGVIASVKNIDETRAKVIEPATTAANESGRTKPTVVATHWTVRGADDNEGWKALAAWRGLRAPNRLTATDPAQLRAEADKLPRSEILARYTRVETADDYLRVYGELIRELRPTVIGIQTTSLDQLATIRMVGQEVLGKLRTIDEGGA
ncbi:MAG TPA: LLM class flavin-dependent oxidoreductase [Candidatus Saccharimonadia bacterium]|nr:LLM class flavin-dependent oxidoreductase [Candidatus Saccharimonadia bacterium]